MYTLDHVHVVGYTKTNLYSLILYTLVHAVNMCCVFTELIHSHAADRFFILLQISMNVTAILVTTLAPTMLVHLCVGVMKDTDWKEAQLV